MKGSHDIVVRNNRLCYKFTIQRNLTILRGDSATGKTTLIEMINDNCKNGLESGVEILSDVRCVVLERGNWERDLSDFDNCIVFIDEGNGFVSSKAFAEMVKNSTNYFVIATRESLFSLPYSIHEIYGIRNKSGNRYQGTKRLYSELYRLYNSDAFVGRPDLVIVEDSNSAYEFWKSVCKKEKIDCITANGKSNIYRSVLESTGDKILVIADGAAFGPEIERAMFLNKLRNVVYFLPESFEWLILRSGLIDGNELKNILAHPSDFVESGMYMSWEQFFTALLIEDTKDTYLAYSKRSLNPTYLQKKTQNAILKEADEIAGGTLI